MTVSIKELHNNVGRTNRVKLWCVLLLFTSCAAAGEKPTSLGKTCVSQECHGSYSAKKYVHGPVALNDCKACHKTLVETDDTFELVREGGKLCSSCHLEQTSGTHLHKPLETGYCTSCHDPHSSDYQFLIPVPRVSDLCQKCHAGMLKGKKVLHGPVAAGQCTLCHSSHSSDFESLLTDDPRVLCFYCHEATEKELQRFEFVHEPVTEQGCGGCHDAHGGDDAMMLKDEVPGLCLSCHEEIASVVANAKYQHGAVGLGGKCTTCHTPHASTVRFGLKADPMTLCVSCHDKEIKTQRGETLASFTSEIKNKQFMHGPVAEKDCGACHVSHGSDHFRLLTEDYPAKFYAPFDVNSYQLCFTCHPQSSVLTPETKDLTDFRNGTVNLHYLHVNKPDKGRTCRACHATHASSSPKHIRQSVPYGMWDLPIQFQKTETGGGCRPGCHKPKAYDRINPVSYSVPEESPPAEEVGEPNDAKI